MRHWASLRWDDCQGLNPGTFKRLARGLTAQLPRTKTSGPGKKMEVLPIFISEDAYLANQWLYPGWALWTDTALSTNRDYFLPLPDLKLEAATKRRALRRLLGLLAELLGRDDRPGWASPPSPRGWALLVRTLGQSWP